MATNIFQIAAVILLLVGSLYGSLAQRSTTINVTILEEAVKEGAVCLDGTPPAYYFRPNNDSRNWLLFLEGGGLCSGPSNQESSCFNRSLSYFGSSKSDYVPQQNTFDGGAFIVSKERNPDFWDWNHVSIHYCDGGSFAGEVQEPVPVTTGTNETRYVYYRGRRIWNYIMRNLLDKGMKDADKIVLSGCSSGAMATALFCNDLKELVGSQTSVKCSMDGGLIADLPQLNGSYYTRPTFEEVVQEHNITIGVERKYVPSSAPYQQLFPPYFLPSIKEPLFLLNPAYDSWQIRNTLQYHIDEWRTCVLNFTSCESGQLEILQGFRDDFFEALEPSLWLQKKDWATFINSCFHHCQADVATVKINNQTILEVMGDWVYNRKVTKAVDWLPWPNNPTCTTYIE